MNTINTNTTKSNFPNKQLLNITVYKYTWNDFYKLRQKSDNYQQLEKILPKYCFNLETGKIVVSYYYYQYIGSYESKEFDKEVYYLFDFNFATELLNEEFGQSGLEDLLNEYSINLVDLVPKLFINEFEERYIPIQSNIILNFDYVGSYDECDLEMSLDGYLDENYNLIKI
jgi:hypothetical protein